MPLATTDNRLEGFRAEERRKVILEVVLLNIRSGQSSAFEKAFADAQAILASMEGYISHQLQRSLETADKYVLLVHWRRVEDHTVGFRQSAGFQEWKRLLHHFYDPAPIVEHFEAVLQGNTREPAPSVSALR